MKYFTKYLPVPGEIKESDNFLYGLHSSLLGSDYKKKNDPWFPEPVAAKMFLCSRDIQVGDKCYHPILTDYPNYTANEEIGLADMKVHGFFKVIGEVSPAAIWVKEGVEFDDGDLEQGGGYILYYASQISSGAWTKQKDKDFRFIRFKCPTCNTFH